ncbi:hypothetical protein GYMLUDRAFT_178936 [Collybiopsis luxurians FD-317 M1]|uniref:O-methyltransferase domain-containing protein n=1 Tax=Collybiopsis luxurians FD-317 M1 TaxID=944289 RepID=A0A0D0C6I0_9AGAR|nr:hypothetical protein GYMLUDRAFT_178936 [Collybiopsis luxurians FD-317 M1]
MSSEVQQLLDTITKAVGSLQLACSRDGTSIPDIREPFEPSSEGFRNNSEVMEATRIIGAAALQLEAIIAPPQVVLFHVVGGLFKSMALRVCLESHVTEILRDAGKEGMHVRDIAKCNGQDPQKLARFLRYLCSNHVYREVSPDVFANNRASSLLDTQKSISEIHSKPFEKYKNTNGIAALVGLHLDECFKGAAFAWETLNDPAMLHEEEQLRTPLNKAYNTLLSYYSFIQLDEKRGRRIRFDSAMEGMERMQRPDIILNAFEWNTLSKGSKVIDVGGNIGNILFPLAKQFPDLRLIVQDLPEVVDNATQVWTERMPEALQTGQVKLEAYNFFDPQPHKDASVFLLKFILHNWSYSSCVKILKRLRHAAQESTRLVIMDCVMPYVCRSPTGALVNGKGADEAPDPLLANFGSLNEPSYVLDMAMFICLNAQERTYDELNQLLDETGWAISNVRRERGDAASVQIEARPIPIDIPDASCM